MPTSQQRKIKAEITVYSSVMLGGEHAPLPSRLRNNDPCRENARDTVFPTSVRQWGHVLQQRTLTAVEIHVAALPAFIDQHDRMRNVRYASFNSGESCGSVSSPGSNGFERELKRYCYLSSLAGDLQHEVPEARWFQATAGLSRLTPHGRVEGP